MKTINREDLQERVEEDGAALVEVLSHEAFREFHLPHAINVPLEEGFERAIQEAVPNKSQLVILYCQDHQCDASATAAQKMEQLGYTNVYDYEAGKMDWKNAGLTVETEVKTKDQVADEGNDE